MKKNKLAVIVKIIIFGILVFVLGQWLFAVFVYKDMGGGGGWQRFYATEKNIVDVMIYGSSHAHCTVNNAILWDDFGIASYSMTAGSQDLDSTYYFMRETFKRQQPKVVLVEALAVTWGEMRNDTTSIVRNTMGMRWSGMFCEYMQYLAESAGSTDAEKREAFLKVPVIHSRYKELKKEDFEDDIYFFRGYRGSYEWTGFDATPEACNVTETMEIPDDRKEYLQQMIDFCKEQGVQLIFFASPYMLGEEEQMKFNAMEQFAREQEVPFINFNKCYQEIDFDYTRDMREGSHVNNRGAAKVSYYLGQLIKEMAEIPDHRGEKEYQYWDLHSQHLAGKEAGNQLAQGQEITEYLDILSQIPEKYLVIISLNGNYNALGEVYADALEAYGINRESYYQGGVWIKKDGQFIYYSEGAQEYKKVIKVGNNEIRVSGTAQYDEDGEITGVSEIIVQSQDYRKIENGVNIVVYDCELNQFIDTVGTDIYLGLGMIREEK